MIPETTPTTLSGSHNTHARFAPSDSKRWTHCSAAVAFQEANAHRIKADNSSTYSNEGTEAHDWAAKLLLNGIKEKDIPKDFREYVVAYRDHCITSANGAPYMVEVIAPLFYQPSSTGTCDFAVITNERVVIRDLKYGAGVLVEADQNTQLAIYAYSLIKTYEDPDLGYEFTDDTIVELGVFQPRHREAQNARPWVITLRELRKFCDGIEYAFTRACVGTERVRAKLLHPLTEPRNISCADILEAAPGLRFEPGEGDGGACRWCKVKSFCDRRIDYAATELSTEHVDGRDLIAMLPDLTKDEKKLPVEERLAVRLEKAGMTRSAITDEYLVKMYAAKKWIEACLDDAAEYLQERTLSGVHIPGVKLVQGRQGNRAWVNLDEADTFLKNQGLKQEERYDFKVISPTKAEEILKDKLKNVKRTATRFDQLVSRSEGSLTLALESDKRAAVTPLLGVMPNEDIEDFEV